MRIAFFGREIPKRPAAVALVLVAAAGVVIGREQPAPEVVEPKPVRIEKTAALPDIDLGKLERGEIEAPQNDPFAPRSFAPVRQAAGAAAQAPEKPKGPPPLPFTYAGWMTQDGKTEIFIARGEELISIAVGQEIDAQYRVDSITDERIAFTYLPLKKRQSIERTETNG